MSWLVIAASMCTPGKGFEERLLDWQFVEAMACQYADVTGFLVLGLIVWSAVSSAIYIRTDSFIIPFGLLMMTGGAALSQMANVAVPVAVTLVLVIPASVTAYLYWQYGR
jgi:hypothetical protein